MKGAGEPEQWIVVTNWRRFQHYKDRDPPWIKTYPRLLSDPNYLDLTDHCALVLHRLWLEYARSGCQLRVNTSSLSRQLGVRVMKRDLESLNHAGFIRFSASAPLAARARSRETEAEKEKSLPAREASYEAELEKLSTVLGRQAGSYPQAEESEEPWS